MASFHPFPHFSLRKKKESCGCLKALLGHLVSQKIDLIHNNLSSYGLATTFSSSLSKLMN